MENNIQQEELKEKDTLVEDIQEEILENEETNKCEQSNEEDNVLDIDSELEEKKLQEEIDALNDQYQRLQAEYANYRRRTQQEKL